MRVAALALTVLCTGCSALYYPPETLGYEAPPPELGRPGWVRFFAGTGAWVGAIGGGIISIAALPVTYPITWLADEPLGYSKQEFLWMPVTLCASTGHVGLGAPVDTLDFVLRRAWFEDPPAKDYEYTPMKPSMGPGADAPAAADAETAPENG